MNRKGEVAMVLLFVFVFVFSMMCLYIFLSFDDSYTKKSVEISELTKEVDFAENYVKEVAKLIGEETVDCKDPELKESDCLISDMKERYKAIAKRHDLGYESSGNFFAKIRNGEFELLETGVGRNWILKVDGLFVKSVRGENSITRNFNFGLDLR